jgi:hypothetical protein
MNREEMSIRLQAFLHDDLEKEHSGRLSSENIASLVGRNVSRR